MLLNKKTFTMDWNLPSPKWMFIINALLLLLHVSVAKTLEPILWDKHIFQRNGPDGYRIEANINDVINVICPKINNTIDPDSAQYHTFTQVSRLGYENCDLKLGGAKTLLRCNRPFLVNELRLFFQDQTTYPGDPVFSHGRDYYFITTANGSRGGLSQQKGGLCQSHNMKVIIHMNGERHTPYPTTSHRTPEDRFVSPTTTLPLISTKTSPKSATKLATTVKPTRRKVTSNEIPSRTGDNDLLRGGDNGSTNHRLSSLVLLLCSTIAFIRWLRC